MFTKKIFVLIFIQFIILSCIPSFAQDDVKGSKDHPLISRYEDSYIIGYEQKSYDQLELPVGPYDSDDTKIVNPEGKVTRILYAAPRNRSAVEVFRNYQQALLKADFNILYECDDNNCYKFTWMFHEGETALKNRGDLSKFALAYDNTKDERYLLAKKSEGRSEAYIAVYSAYFTAEYSSKKVKEEMKNRPVTLLQIIESKEMETGKVDIDADAMLDELSSSGKVKLYGIHFDVDKATIKDNSKSTLQEIATLLKKESGVKIAVVGHTDMSGNIDYNMNLSEKRAKAVVEYLTDKHGISGERLKSFGVGPLAPVATNETEEGRALNRRVELIKLK